MKLLFYRNTHENGEAKTLTPEAEVIWNDQTHAGGFVAHMLDSTHGKTFLKVLDAVCSYEDLHHDYHYTTDEILAALFELVRVDLVRYEIVP